MIGLIAIFVLSCMFIGTWNTIKAILLMTVLYFGVLALGLSYIS